MRGIQDQNAGEEVRTSVGGKDGPRQRHPAFPKQAVLRRPALRGLHRVSGGREETPRRGKRRAAVHTVAHAGVRVLILQPPPEQPPAVQRPPTGAARIFCFVVFFRSINKCVIVNVKTHQSNNNGTKSKDYPSLLVTAE